MLSSTHAFSGMCLHGLSVVELLMDLAGDRWVYHFLPAAFFS
jgi:hypothetical protein